jgi:hypothetical protein
VTPTLYDRFSEEDLKSFGRGQVVRLEVPFGFSPRASNLYWRTAFLLDAGKKETYQHIQGFMDWEKKNNGRPEPAQEWKNAQGRTTAYFEPIRNIDVRKVWGLGAFYETLDNPPRLQETIGGWFRPLAAGEHQFFIQGGPGVRMWIESKEVKDGDSLPLEVNDYPLMLVSQAPYDPKDSKKTVWPKAKLTFNDPGGKTHDLTEDWFGNGYYCGVEGRYYATPEPKGTPSFSRKDAFLDFTSAGDFGLAQPPALSAKWSGVFDISAEATGTYELRVETNGHFRLWIDKKEILYTPSVPQGMVVLAEGTHELLALYNRKPGNPDPPKLHLLAKGPKDKEFGLFFMTKKSWDYK